MTTGSSSPQPTRTAAKFVTSPDTTMRGSIVAAVLDSLNYENYRHIVDPVLAEHDYDVLEPDRFYSAQMLLDVYKTMEDNSDAMFNFVAIGKQVAQTVEFPPEVTDIVSAVGTLNTLSRYMLQGYDEREDYEVAQLDEAHLQIRDNNPYPHDMVFGYIYTIVHKFTPEGKTASIKRIFDNPDAPNQGGAVYDVTWK